MIRAIAVFIVLLGGTAFANAQCVPSYYQTSESSEVADPELLLKTVWYRVTFPDFTPGTGIDTYASGQGKWTNYYVCGDAASRVIQCWPVFNAPQTTQNRWSQVVYDRWVQYSHTAQCSNPNPFQSVSVYTCQPLRSVTYSVDHVCASCRIRCTTQSGTVYNFGPGSGCYDLDPNDPIVECSADGGGEFTFHSGYGCTGQSGSTYYDYVSFDTPLYASSVTLSCYSSLSMTSDGQLVRKKVTVPGGCSTTQTSTGSTTAAPAPSGKLSLSIFK